MSSSRLVNVIFICVVVVVVSSYFSLGAFQERTTTTNAPTGAGFHEERNVFLGKSDSERDSSREQEREERKWEEEVRQRLADYETFDFEYRDKERVRLRDVLFSAGMPAIPDFEFSREHCLFERTRPYNGTLVISVANHAHLQLSLNWIENMKRQGLGENFFIFCVEQAMLSELTSRGVPAALIPPSWLPANLAQAQEKDHTHKEAFYGAGDYYLITHFKPAVVRQLILQGFNVVFSDVDVAWIADGVLDYFHQLARDHPRAILFASLEEPDARFLPPYINSGMYFVRASKEGAKLFEHVIVDQHGHPERGNQFSMNWVMDAIGFKDKRPNSEMIISLENTCLFVSGKRHFLSNKTKDCEKIYTAHANYMVGRGKKEIRVLITTMGMLLMIMMTLMRRRTGRTGMVILARLC